MAPFVQGAPLQDTTLASIREMVANAGRTRALLIEISLHTWWSTRLYLLSVLTQALTPVRQFVFSTGPGVFAGMASPAAVRDGLCASFPEIAAFDTELRQGNLKQGRSAGNRPVHFPVESAAERSRS